MSDYFFVYGFVLLAMDYFEQQTAIENIIERIKYREMVCSGAWQDYKELKPECLKKEQER